MSFTAKQKSLAIIPKLSGSLSFIGSSYILQDVLRSRARRSKPYNRIVLGMSIFDVMASVVNIMSTWPTPEGTKGVFGAVGTTETCTAQGFFNETGNVCTPLYNASLCMYYMLVIRSGWSERSVRKVEPFMHALPLTVGWTMGIIGLPLDLYNNSGWLCWIAPYPKNCIGNDDVDCERGELAFLFRWIHYGIIWSAIAFVTVGMLIIYLEVRKKEKATARYTQPRRSSLHVDDSEREQPKRMRRMSLSRASDDGGEGASAQAKSKHSRKVATQAMLFVGALYLTWIFTTLTRIFQTVQGKTHYPLLVLMAIFFPLQGFFNAIIYLRPRFLKYKKKHPELSLWRIIWNVLRSGQHLDATTEVSMTTQHRSSLTTKIRRLSAAVGGRRMSGHDRNHDQEKAKESSPPANFPAEEKQSVESACKKVALMSSVHSSESGDDHGAVYGDEFDDNQNV